MEKRTQGVVTILQLGPADHGRLLSLKEFETARYSLGYRYELVEGRLYVFQFPTVGHDCVLTWLKDQFRSYEASHRTIINYVSTRPCVFVPGPDGITLLGPDLAAYNDYPFHVPKAEREWRLMSPFLVAEITIEDDPEKDLVRNVDLYSQVPSIREYWIVDTRDYENPHLLVHRRCGQRWQRVIQIASGETYSTRWLPEFKLVFDLSKA